MLLIPYLSTMPSLWRRVVVLLVIVIAVLQVIHMTLLSRLEARKSDRRQREVRSEGWDNSESNLHEVAVKEERTRMLKIIQHSSVLDSTGEFHIINFLVRAESFGSRNYVRQDVSLVTQTSINYLHYLEMITTRWHGPISVAVFTLTQNIPLAVESILQLRKCFPAIRYNTSFHLVYPLNSPSGDTASIDPLVLDSCDDLLNKLLSLKVSGNYAHGVPYPNNLLRNVARRNALTEFVFVTDIDLVPNDHLHKDFMDFARENRLFTETQKDDKTVYVVPAFEMKDGVDIPHDKTSLLQLLELMEARPFYFELCWKCQKHTDYETWQREPPAEKLGVLFEVLWRDPWEPFYIGRNSAPFYDERFRQYGFNRISQWLVISWKKEYSDASKAYDSSEASQSVWDNLHIIVTVCELHMAGYKFSVLNNAFVIHKGLKTPSSFHKEKDLEQERNRALFRQFKAELKEKYPDSSRRCY